MKEYIKHGISTFVLFGVMAIGFFLFTRGCFQAQTEPQKPTIVITRDTQYIQQPPVTIPQYQPIIVETKPPTIIPQQMQPSQHMEVLLKQYQELLDRFLSSNRYQDSIVLKDSLLHDVGIVRLDDIINENKIKSRAPSYSLKFPVITEKITITQPYKPRNQWFVGGAVNGNKLNLVDAFKAGLLVKNKKDNIFAINGTINRGGYLGAEVGFYTKIKIGKR